MTQDAANIAVIACLSDNYAYILHDPVTNEAALFDAPAAEPILETLAQTGWRLSHLFITHHHDDHVAGVEAIRALHQPQVIGAAADASRLPPLDVQVKPGDSVSLMGGAAAVIETYGHTVGHLSYHLPHKKALFCGDALFAMGCGRIFEGEPQQMWEGLARLAALPEDTQVCFGHEYTVANAEFALDVDPQNSALHARVRDVIEIRRGGGRTAPSTIGLERATNPFLRAADPGVRAAVGLPDAADWEVFAEVRRRKDAA